MNIKSLLLGSAATLVAVSGARAADAVVYEPEPVEYVKVCDAYGAGFFYIPGTETCLSLSGYVWFQVGAENYQNIFDTPSYHNGARVADGWAINTRARFNIDARSDTEWGTLRSYIRFQSTWNGYLSVDGATAVDQAFIELGGWRMGYSESAYNQTMKGGVSNWGSHSWTGMSYAYQQRPLISYTFAANGFSATLSLEDDANGNYMPDVVGVVAYNAGWGGAWAKVAYNEQVGLTDAFNASIGMQFNMPNMPGSNLRLIGFYSEMANEYSVGSEYSILASYNHVFSEKLSASIAFQYMMDTNYAAAGSPDAYQAELSVVYMPVKNFEVRGELAYTKADGFRDGTTSGFLRFTRYF